MANHLLGIRLPREISRLPASPHYTYRWQRSFHGRRWSYFRNRYEYPPVYHRELEYHAPLRLCVRLLCYTDTQYKRILHDSERLSLTLLIGAATTEAGANLSNLTSNTELSHPARPILAAGLATLVAGSVISTCGAIIYRKPNWHVPLRAVVIMMSLLGWFGTINLLSHVGPLVPYAALGLAEVFLGLAKSESSDIHFPCRDEYRL